MTYRLVRAVAFRLDPERVHRTALWMHRWLRPFRRPFPVRSVQVMGLEFPNVVGLAAGYDKDAVAWRGLAALGFGHVEVGTVTPRPQAGNPAPRLFRLPEDRGLINRMGFPSAGADAVADRLHGHAWRDFVLGVSIGPNKDTPPDRVAEDYETLVDRFAPLADYLAINVSSPNTPGLRSLQSSESLGALLARIVARRDIAGGQPTARSRQPEQSASLRERTGRERRDGGGTTRLVVKLSPDIPDAELAETVATIDRSGVDGIIVTNTTVSRPGLSDDPDETGGLSGAPLASRSLAVLATVRDLTDLPLIASGGIMSATDAGRRLDAGASLVQLYTGLVYQGPSLVHQIAELEGNGRHSAREPSG